MNAQTTTRKTARTFRPEILDCLDRIAALKNGREHFDTIAQKAKDIETALPSIGTKNARQTWHSAEENFLAFHGMTWGEALSLQELSDSTAPEPTKAPAQPQTAAPSVLPGLTAKDIEGLRKVFNENPNATIPRPLWGKVFSGACASRRAGLDFRTWATRTTAIPRPIVADIAFRVWSLPESELVKNAPVRAAF